MPQPLRWIKIWCERCGFRTDHLYLPELQSPEGLAWRCERCRNITVLTAHQASLCEPA